MAGAVKWDGFFDSCLTSFDSLILTVCLCQFGANFSSKSCRRLFYTTLV